MEFKHKPVLLNECIENLNINPNGTYIDGTLGGAGHSLEIAKRLSKNGLLIGIDKDMTAIDAAQLKLKEFNNVRYINNNHDNIKGILEELEITKVDGILLDLGVSSHQIDEQMRRF
jgi:16S rRNA (cytosine1402-N4)-methyltransferase